MAGKVDKFEYDLLRAIFNGVAITNICATGGTTSLWVGLMTADPAEAGSTASEGGYTEYTRVKTDRSSATSTGWSVTSGASTGPAGVSPVTALNFPAQVTTSTGTFTHFMLFPSSNAQASSGFYFGTLSPSINFGAGVTPSITTGSSITED